jgi:hypothetical protein
MSQKEIEYIMEAQFKELSPREIEFYECCVPFLSIYNESDRVMREHDFKIQKAIFEAQKINVLTDKLILREIEAVKISQPCCTGKTGLNINS